MGSGDLNMKKSWHPQRSGNVAATQKAEADAIAERKKLQLRLQEIEEERRKEEIQKALEAAGGKRKIDRVEWMYSGPNDGQTGDSAESEAYLLGKRRIDKLIQDNEMSKLSKQPSQDSVAVLPAINNARDIASKIREDPLLAIKRQEQQAYEAMMNDPIKRRQLLASMGMEDPQKDKKKEERRERHRHHHRSHRSHRSDRDDDRHSRRPRSDSRERSRSPRSDRSRDRRRHRSRSPRGDRPKSPRRHRSRSVKRERSRSPGRHRDGDEHKRRRRDSPDAGRHRPGSDGEERRNPHPPREDARPERRGSVTKKESRSPSPAPRRRERSLEREGPPRNSFDQRNGNRGGGSYPPRRDYDNSRPRHNGGGPTGPNSGPDMAEQERARKLAAMQEAATDLDQDRARRLAAIEAAEKAQREADDQIRQRNKKFGGDAGFTNSLHSRAADMKVADRMRTR
ncbi:pre-mRNA-splicing factor CWC25 [Podospora conica]|nr:pre-mRNA-splicing factor CWC25 [Schizothecium conicum]